MLFTWSTWRLQIMLSSDEPVFGGFSNVTKNSDVTFASSQFEHDGRPNSFLVSALHRCLPQLSGPGCPTPCRCQLR